MEFPVRILHVLGRLDRGGAETMVMNLYRNIDRSKIQFDFVIHTTDKCDYSEEIEKLGGKIYSMPKYVGKNHFQYKSAWKNFFNVHPEYTIIHGHMRSTASIYLKIATQYNLKTIAHSHNTSSGEGISAIVKNLFQYPIRHIADYLFACSKNAGIWLFGKNACERDNFFILNNAIDAKKFIYDETKRNMIRSKLGIGNELLIGHVGRFHPQKNHKFIINIFQKIQDINPNSKLILVGDGDLKAVIQNEVFNLGIGNSVVFMGIRNDIEDILQAMDIFIFPSLYEGLGIVAIEAQASGLPCLVSDVIPKETFITELIHAMPLNEEPKLWAKKICELSYNYERRSYFNEICSNGYDISLTTKWLEKFYLEIENGCE